MLAHVGPKAKPALAILNDLLPLAESDREDKWWLALRTARAFWKISGDSSPAVGIAEQMVDGEQA